MLIITDTTVQRACIMRRQAGYYLHNPHKTTPARMRAGLRMLRDMIRGLTDEQRAQYSEYIEATR